MTVTDSLVEISSGAEPSYLVPGREETLEELERHRGPRYETRIHG